MGCVSFCAVFCVDAWLVYLRVLLVCVYVRAIASNAMWWYACACAWACANLLMGLCAHEDTIRLSSGATACSTSAGVFPARGLPQSFGSSCA